MNCKAESPKLELKLKLSPPRDHRQVLSPGGSISSNETSPRSSCVSREASPDEAGCLSGRREETSPMMLVGCPRCLMYVMLLRENPKCPKCKSTVLLDFLNEDGTRKLKK
ncbi:UNVERIFIED_CONTAM: protein salt-induced and EIN3/EIL1-dependent 1 [Sesamum calycinum]|uniref:Protein salt-induced and EIN3/EIL1-dependent 1 n=2 Tax=Sesamum TaxID=4181 RepID=A0AAW2SBT4_9LAMI